jgi:hypothetical protein
MEQPTDKLAEKIEIDNRKCLEIFVAAYSSILFVYFIWTDSQTTDEVVFQSSVNVFFETESSNIQKKNW